MKKRENAVKVGVYTILTGLLLAFIWSASYMVWLNRQSKGSYAHFSLDDTITVFQDLTRNEYDSIFSQPLLGYLKEKHDECGLTVSLYCFYETDGFDLSMCTDRYAAEFTENASWLRFGYHSIAGENWAKTDANTARADYDRMIEQLLRITGSGECLDVMPRLQDFAGSSEAVTGAAWYNADFGIRGLLAPDDDRACYYLSSGDTAHTKTAGSFTDEERGLLFVTTDLCLENVGDPQSTLLTLQEKKGKNQTYEIFAHEGLFDDAIKVRLEEAISFIEKNGYKWGFAQDRLL